MKIEMYNKEEVIKKRRQEMGELVVKIVIDLFKRGYSVKEIATTLNEAVDSALNYRQHSTI